MADPVGSVQVFILAENRFLREALTRILNKRNDIRVVGAAAFSPDAVPQVGRAAPAVLLSDSAALTVSGLRLIAELRAAISGLKVVLIGMEDDARTFLQAVKDGVAGYVLKDASAFEVAAALRSVANDEAICPPKLCMALFDSVAAQRSVESRFVIGPDLGLTRRERQLVHLISNSLTNKQIASQLNLSEQTVKNHIHRLLRKLGANDRFGAVEVCRASGTGGVRELGREVPI